MKTEFLEIAIKIGLSALLAGIVGAERERTGKWAGLRTHMLIAVGSALLTHISVYIGIVFHQGSNAWDPGRIAAQIVSGVGFLGAGTIIQSRGAVHGLTTAAGLWVASAIGIAVGAGFYGEAALTALTLLLILSALRPVERLLGGKRRSLVFDLKPEQKLSRLMELLEEAKIDTQGVSVSRHNGSVSVVVRYQGEPEDGQRLIRTMSHEEFAAREEDEEKHRGPLP